MRACTLAELDAAGGLLPIAAGDREAVVVRAGTGEVFAVARACPHEGYPLEEGDRRRRDDHLPLARLALRPALGRLPDGRRGHADVPRLDRGRRRCWSISTSPSARASAALRADALRLGARGGRRAAARRATPCGCSRRARRRAEIAPLLARFAASHGHGPRARGRRRRRRARARRARARADRAAAGAGRVDRRGARRARAPRASRPSRAAVSPTSARAGRPRRSPAGSPSATPTAPRRSSPASSSAAWTPRRGRRAARRRGEPRASAARGRSRWSSAPRGSRALDRDVARLVLPAAARDVASAPALDRVAPVRRATARRAAPAAELRARPRRLARGLRARARDRPDRRRLAARRGRGARVRRTRRPGAARRGPRAHAGVAGRRRARLARRPDAAASARARRARSPRRRRGQSPAGAAIILAATYAALELGVPEALAGVARLIETPRRERFVARALGDAHGRSDSGPRRLGLSDLRARRLGRGGARHARLGRQAGGQSIVWLGAAVRCSSCSRTRCSSAELGAAFPGEGGPYALGAARRSAGRPAALARVLYWIGNPIWLGGTLAIVVGLGLRGVLRGARRRARPRRRSWSGSSVAAALVDLRRARVIAGSGCRSCALGLLGFLDRLGRASTPSPTACTALGSRDLQADGERPSWIAVPLLRLRAAGPRAALRARALAARRGPRRAAGRADGRDRGRRAVRRASRSRMLLVLPREPALRASAASSTACAPSSRSTAATWTSRARHLAGAGSVLAHVAALGSSRRS